jgi:2'-5' RNA ligase
MPLVRWVRADLWHLTLVFLAERPTALVPGICDLVASVCRDEPPFALRIDGIGCFPNGTRPRVLWLGVGPGSDALQSLHRNVLGALQSGGIEIADERFSAHLTVGRVRDDAGTEARGEIGRRWAALSIPPLPLFDATELHLMRSDLGTGGPRYTSMAALPLAGARKV